jgi:hypothetical protein
MNDRGTGHGLLTGLPYTAMKKAAWTLRVRPETKGVGR